MLNHPPAGTKTEQIRSSMEWDEGAAGAAFMAQMAARGGAGRVARDGVRNVATEK